MDKAMTLFSGEIFTLQGNVKKVRMLTCFEEISDV